MNCVLYNQRDATYCYKRSTCFGRFFRPASGAYKIVCAAWGIVMLSCCLPLVWMGWNYSGQQENMKNPTQHIQFYKLPMMGGKTVRNMQSADNNKEHCISCISLVIQNTHLGMHGSMNVKKIEVLNFKYGSK